MNFFQKLLSRLKPTDYAIQVNSDNTASTTIRKTKTSPKTKTLKLVSVSVMTAVIVGSGATAVFASSTMSAETARAGILEETFCVDGGKKVDDITWGAGSNRFAALGGYSTSMTIVTKNMTAETQLRMNTGLKPNLDGVGPSLTAYEKYGTQYPMYESWTPAYSNGNYTFRGTGSGGVADSMLHGGVEVPNIEPGNTMLIASDVGSCLAFVQKAETIASNAVAYVPKILMGISIELYGMASGQSVSDPTTILGKVGAAVDNLVAGPGGLKDSLFLKFLLPLITIGALWLIWSGIVKRQAVVALQSIVWMILAVALGVLVLEKPTRVAGFFDSVVATAQQAINGSVANSGSDLGMCQISNSTLSGPDGVRSIQCTVWYASLYAPWVTGQFGAGVSMLNSPGTNEYKVLTADSRGILNSPEYNVVYGDRQVNPDNWPQFMVDRQSNGLALQISEVAYAQLSGNNDGVMNATWKGGSGSQLMSAFTLWISFPAHSLVLLVYGSALLIYQLMMITALFMAPFFFLIAVIPNYGKSIVLRWFELLVMLTIKRIVTALMLAGYFIFYLLIIKEITVFALLLQIVLVWVLAIFAIQARGKFINMFANKVDFGGNKSLGLPGGKAAARTAGIGGAAVGGLVGGGLGAIVGGVVAKKKIRNPNKDMEGDLKSMEMTSAPAAGGGRVPSAPQSAPAPSDGGGAGSKVTKEVTRQASNVATDAAKEKLMPGSSNAPNAPKTKRTPKGGPSTPSPAAPAPAPTSGGTPPTGSKPEGNRPPKPASKPSVTPSTPPPGGPKPPEDGGTGPTGGGSGPTGPRPTSPPTGGSGGGTGANPPKSKPKSSTGSGSSPRTTSPSGVSSPSVPFPSGSNDSGGSETPSSGLPSPTVSSTPPPFPAASTGAATATTGTTAATTATTATAAAGTTGAATLGASGAVGTAAAGSAIAGGAAAGSVVPGAGTVVGAAAAATVVGTKKLADKLAENKYTDD